ncbi:MAG: RNA-directed DNA polymerase [Candidatus Ozemobacteraceae bacterium]
MRELEKIWEPIFIHDSYACRKNRGTHAAVERIQTFTRRATANGTRRAWFAQLDIEAFFPSIDRRRLLEIVLAKLKNPELRWLAELLILHDPSIDPVFTCSHEKWRAVPPHKSLFTVAPGKGLPIGNLTSQFFANIYLNPLDQFIKHTLKVQAYVRYVDDLIFVHEDPDQLRVWFAAVSRFLGERLELKLNAKRCRIMPVSNGINAFGYIIWPSHLLVRRRTIQRCREALHRGTKGMARRFPMVSVSPMSHMIPALSALSAFSSLSANPALPTPTLPVIPTNADIQRSECAPESRRTLLHFPPSSQESLRATFQSYLGLFGHAASGKLVASLLRRYPVMSWLFRLDGNRLVRRWHLPFRPGNFRTQWCFFRERFRGLILTRIGCFWELFDRDAVRYGNILGLRRIRPRPGFYSRCGISLTGMKSLLSRLGQVNDSILWVDQTGRFVGTRQERCGVASNFGENLHQHLDRKSLSPFRPRRSVALHHQRQFTNRCGGKL